MYRPRTWRKIERVREKRKKRDEWYRKGGYDSVIFEPATPGSELKRLYEKEIEEAGMKIKVTGSLCKNLMTSLDQEINFSQTLYSRLPLYKGCFRMHFVFSLIIYMTKLLQSDWLRGVQLFH